MDEVDINDLLKELGGGGVSTPSQDQDIQDVLKNLGTYNAPPAESSLLSEYFNKAKGAMGTVTRGAELLGRGAAQTVPTTVAGFAAGGVPGALVGSMAIPFGDTLNSIINRTTGTNLRMPSEVISTNLAKLGYKEPTTQAGRVTEAAGGGLGGAASQLSSMYNLAKVGGNPLINQISQTFTQNAPRQVGTAAAAGAGGQYVAEETNSPFAGLLASLGIGATAGISPTRKAIGAPTNEDLVMESKNLFDKARSSGVQFDNTKFADSMFDIGKSLRNEGYTPKAYPGIASVLEEMTNVQNPKDFTELQAIRKMIQNQQGSPDSQTRRLATALKDDFDSYVLNAPKEHFTTGTTQGVKDWADARNSYSRLKKSEIFDDMMTNAELDKSKFTQSGAENSLATQLRQLAKNDKKMRMFSPDEQDAIREAAKGGTAQNMLKFYGRFAPHGPVSSIFSGGATVLEPLIGVPFALGAEGSRRAATAMRSADVENLGAQMRLGAKPKLSPRFDTTQSILAAPSQLRTTYLSDIGKQ
jgi:hypothetical protein